MNPRYTKSDMLSQDRAHAVSQIKAYLEITPKAYLWNEQITQVGPPLWGYQQSGCERENIMDMIRYFNGWSFEALIIQNRVALWLKNCKLVLTNNILRID